MIAGYSECRQYAVLQKVFENNTVNGQTEMQVELLTRLAMKILTNV